MEEPGVLDTDVVEVRTLTMADLGWMVRIDAEFTGRERTEYYRVKLEEAERDTGVRISLSAFLEGEPAGFLMGRLYYGEFGMPEPVAILDSLAVSRARQGKLVGKALMRQLRMNLHALGIEKLQTQVEWDQVELVRFFQRVGFRPAPRLCLELDLSTSPGA